VEIPSDLLGILYVPFESGFWKMEIVREMKAAGIEVDANLAI
jgi:hypothetical protein